MSDHDVPPELRRRSGHPEALPIELPLDDDLPPPPVRKPDSAAPEQGDAEPFLRRS